MGGSGAAWLAALALVAVICCMACLSSRGSRRAGSSAALLAPALPQPRTSCQLWQELIDEMPERLALAPGMSRETRGCSSAAANGPSFAWSVKGEHFAYSGDSLRDALQSEAFSQIDWHKQFRVLGDLVDLLRPFSEVCEKLRVPWWLAAGSVLGFLRNGSLIPWDDDLDIYMRRSDLGRLAEEVVPALKPHGLSAIIENDYIIKIVRQPECYPFIDVFFKHPRKKDRLWLPVQPYGRPYAERTESTPERKLFPLRPISLHGVKAYLQNDPLYQAKTQYGDACLTTFKVHNLHTYVKTRDMPEWPYAPK